MIARLLALVGGLAVLGAGCLGTPTPHDDPPVQEEAGEPTDALPPVETGTLVNGSSNATDAAKATWRVVFQDNGVLGAEVMSWIGGNTHPDSRNVTLPFVLGPQATGLVAELAWDDPLTDLDLFVQSHHDCSGLSTPDFAQCITKTFVLDEAGSGTYRADGGSPGLGDNPARLVLGEQDLLLYPCTSPSCDWRLLVWAKLTPGTPFRTAVTVFYGETPPADYHVLS